MWYFLPAHPVILNFYYFVNCFIFIFIFYYYYFILYFYIYIFYFFIYFLFFLLSPLFSLFLFLSSTYSHLPPILSTSWRHAHLTFLPSFSFFYFISLLLTHFPGFPFWLLYFFLPLLGLATERPHPDLHSPHL